MHGSGASMDLRHARLITRRVSTILLKTPIEKLAVIILTASALYGLVTMIEPVTSLRFRRSVRPWKLVPYLCNLTAVQSLVDNVFLLGNLPYVAVCLLVVRVSSNLLLFPLMTFFTALSNPVIVRSIIILVGLPCCLLTLFCRIPHSVSRRLFHGSDVAVTWLFTAGFLTSLQAYSPLTLNWAVADISIPTYLAMLATSLTVASVQQRLHESPARAKLRRQSGKTCKDFTVLCSLYLLAGVVAIWIIMSSDYSLSSFHVLSDLRKLNAGSRLHPHSFPHPHLV